MTEPTEEGRQVMWADDQNVWHCQSCDYEADSESKVWGHIGGKHQKIERPIRHGTAKGYQTERRRGLVTCAACKAAWARFYRDKRGSKLQGMPALKKWLEDRGRKL